ncbi:hypothetical protein [Candidatus Palauibacter sp.]|uniref:hypothetical protein n=1 Tax=Candidatus Palauibacter sp. TaxID=3101350 RepID=UPI003CC53090
MRLGPIDAGCECGCPWLPALAATGLAAIQRTCPKCKRTRVTLFRGRSLVGSRVLRGTGDDMNRALLELGLTHAEVAALLDGTVGAAS